MINEQDYQKVLEAAEKTAPLQSIGSLKDLYGTVVRLSYDPQVHHEECAGIEPYCIILGTGTDSVAQVKTVSAALIAPISGMFVTGDRRVETDGPCNGWILRRSLTATFPRSALGGWTGERLSGSVLDPKAPQRLLPEGVIHWGDESEKILSLYDDFLAFESDLQSRRNCYLSFLDRTAEHLPDITGKPAEGLVAPDRIVREQFKVAVAALKERMTEVAKPVMEENIFFAKAASTDIPTDELEKMLADWSKFKKIPDMALLLALISLCLYLRSGKKSDYRIVSERLTEFETVWGER